MQEIKNQGAVVTLSKAIEFTHAYQELHPNSHYAYSVGIDKVELIVAQEGCEGIRIYNGYNATDSKYNLVLVGIDKDGADITAGVILEYLVPCPPCLNKSVLVKI